MNIPTMRLYTSSLGEKKEVTMRMMPMDINCPVVECIYDPQAEILAVISKIPKQEYLMVGKLDDNGDLMRMKGGAKRQNGRDYKEERRLIDTFQEFYITSIQEIYEFVKATAENATTFDFVRYFPKEAEQPIKLEEPVTIG